jgi:hypothetical protein
MFQKLYDLASIYLVTVAIISVFYIFNRWLIKRGGIMRILFVFLKKPYDWEENKQKKTNL